MGGMRVGGVALIALGFVGLVVLIAIGMGWLFALPTVAVLGGVGLIVAGAPARSETHRSSQTGTS